MRLKLLKNELGTVNTMPQNVTFCQLLGLEPTSLNDGLALSVVAVLLLFISLIFWKRSEKLKRINQQMLLIKNQSEQARMALFALMEMQTHAAGHIRWELHDNIGQMLSLIKLNLSTQSKEGVEESRQLLASAIAEIRLLSKSIDNDFASSQSVNEFVQVQLQKVERKNGVKTRVLDNTQLYLEKIQNRVIVFSVIQECLQIIVKHAGASEVVLNITGKERSISMEIADNSAGIDFDKQFEQSGIEKIQRRAGIIRAKVIWDWHPGQSTKVLILL